MAEAAARTQLDDDRSTRARIRDAAMRQFAELGVKGATIRGIAQEAGVSAGLVQHHFSTKEALRQACDARVVAYMRDVKARGTAAATSAPVLTEFFDAAPPIVGYLASELAAGSPTAATWFDELADLVREILTSGELGRPLSESDDPKAVAAVQTAMQLGLALLYDHLIRVLGSSGGEPEALVRIAKARLFLSPNRVVDDATFDRLRAALERYQSTLAPAARKQRRRRGR